MNEFQHQVYIFKWTKQQSIRDKYPDLKLLFHIPNGGKRDYIEAKHLKSSGVKAGVPDLFLPVARGKYHGLFIELKTEKGRTSHAQDWWIEALREQGYFPSVCRGWEEAVELLEWYVNGANNGEV